MSTESETKSAGVPAGATHRCAVEGCGIYYRQIAPFHYVTVPRRGRACTHFLRPIAEAGPAPTTAAPAELPNRREFHVSTPAEFAAAAQVAQGGDAIIVPAEWPRESPAERPFRLPEPVLSREEGEAALRDLAVMRGDAPAYTAELNALGAALSTPSRPGCKACALIAKEFGTSKCPWCGRLYREEGRITDECGFLHCAVRAAMGLEKPIYDASPPPPREARKLCAPCRAAQDGRTDSPNFGRPCRCPPDAPAASAPPRKAPQEDERGTCLGHLGPPAVNEPHPEKTTCFRWRAAPSSPEEQLSGKELN